jgi:hypothetical protein
MLLSFSSMLTRALSPSFPSPVQLALMQKAPFRSYDEIIKTEPSIFRFTEALLHHGQSKPITLTSIVHTYLDHKCGMIIEGASDSCVCVFLLYCVQASRR